MLKNRPQSLEKVWPEKYPTEGREALVVEAIAKGAYLIICSNPDEILE